MPRIWPENLKKGMNPFSFLLFTSRPYRGVMVGSLLAVVVAALLNVGTSYVFKMMVNAAATLGQNGSVQALWIAGIAYVLISFGSIITWRISGFVGMHWATGVRATGRYALSSYVTLHGNEYFSNRFGGSIASKVSTAANSTKDMVSLILWNFTGFVVTMISSIIVVYFASPLIATLFVLWILFVTPLNVYFARKRIPLSAAAQKAESALGGATVDLLSNITAVHEYTNRPYELTRLKTLIVKRKEAGLRNWRYGETIFLINGLIETVFIGGMIFAAIYLATQGIISPGDIALILTLVIMVEDRLTFIGQQLNNFADAWGIVFEGLDDILVDHDVVDQNDKKELPKVEGSISFDNVSFRYDGADVFEKLRFAIPAGQRVGLVGRSGAGKSTLVKLLFRHYDLQDGHIRIDTTDIAEITRDSLRKNIAIVPQEPLLFHRTIRENIAYSNPDATEEEVMDAAKRAQAHEFISALPEGYESLVGERGVKLSGGQRQRIAIARALLKNAPILILDEATSALDSESEVAVQKALLVLMENRTVIAIAHRLSTLRAMDRIIVMDNGDIIEDGTHDELVEKGGLYSELWAHQAGGFLDEE